MKQKMWEESGKRKNQKKKIKARKKVEKSRNTIHYFVAP